jgi:hypothetical protein
MNLPKKKKQTKKNYILLWRWLHWDYWRCKHYVTSKVQVNLRNLNHSLSVLVSQEHLYICVQAQSHNQVYSCWSDILYETILTFWIKEVFVCQRLLDFFLDICLETFSHHPEVSENNLYMYRQCIIVWNLLNFFAHNKEILFHLIWKVKWPFLSYCSKWGPYFTLWMSEDVHEKDQCTRCQVTAIVQG